MNNITLCVDSRFMSPYALSAFVALTEKSVPFQVRRVNLGDGENLQPAFRDRSLTARVPMLEYGDLVLTESSAIAEYLEEVFAPPAHRAIYPTEPADRARARQVQAWIRSDLMPIRVERPTTVIFEGPSREPLSREARQAVQKLFHAAEAWLEGTDDHLFGKWCIADTDLAIMLNRLVMNGDEVPPRLADYARHQWQRPSVQAWASRAAEARPAPA